MTDDTTTAADPELVLMRTLLEHVEAKGVGPVRGAELARAVQATIGAALQVAGVDDEDAEQVRRAVGWVVTRADSSLAAAGYQHLLSERGRKSRRAEGKRDGDGAERDADDGDGPTGEQTARAVEDLRRSDAGLDAQEIERRVDVPDDDAGSG